ncbi:TauD/TfdA family dioxygenase [Micromonospora sp. NPDC050980]|uniref:TauD/TfdA family dioxygenase n=1 Tax=Micromonospora sp. NPDC050980 TaxID=3155161 RepID=UPI0034046D1A
MSALVTAAVVNDDPQRWLPANREDLRSRMARSGFVRISGLGVTTAAALRSVHDVLAATPIEPRERFAVSRALGHGAHTEQDWGLERDICPHHEQAQCAVFPGLLLMACLDAPPEGTSMLIADSKAVLGELPPDLVREFRDRGWSLTRNFRPYFGLQWADAFGVSSPAEVDDYCDRNQIDRSWQPDGSLRTVQRRPALVTHPATGEECWFNQIAFFSRWSIDSGERDILESTFGPDGLPFTTAFGDGAPTSLDIYQAITRAYERVTVRVRLNVGDVLLLDNILAAHGREAQAAPRLVGLTLAEPVFSAPDTSGTSAPVVDSRANPTVRTESRTREELS